MSMGDEGPVIVIDNGSGLCKAGFAGDDEPRTVFPCVLGKPKHKRPGHASSQNHVIIGHTALIKRGVLSLRYPIEHGIVTNWDDMETFWNHTFTKELCVDPKDRSVLLTEAPLNPISNRTKMAELMFEKFGVNYLNISIQAVLSLYATGYTSGLVADIGDGVAHTVPVFEGYSMFHGIDRVNVAGRDVTGHLRRELSGRGIVLETSSEKDIARDIKETMCYVSLNPDNEKESFESYTLPDGNTIELGSERYLAPEVLFEPGLLGLEGGGVHESIFESINKCDMTLKRTLFSNIILSGGSTKFKMRENADQLIERNGRLIDQGCLRLSIFEELGVKGFPERVEEEVRHLAPEGCKIGVIAKEGREYMVWRGGSVVGCLSCFKDISVSKEEFLEHGSNIIEKKRK